MRHPPGLERKERSLGDELQRVVVAKSEDDSMAALSNALDLIHSLDEYHRERLGKHRYWNELEARREGQIVGALTYVRGFDHHKLAISTTSLGDRYSDFVTEMVGVLVWRDELPFSDRNKPHGRDVLYQSHVASKPVPDTLAVAQEFFNYIRAVE